jgi:hypothetical protein
MYFYQKYETLLIIFIFYINNVKKKENYEQRRKIFANFKIG